MARRFVLGDAQIPQLGLFPSQGHPLFPDLGCFFYTQGGGQLFPDLSNGIHTGKGQNSIAWAVTPFGPGVLVNASNHYIDCGPRFLTKSPWSWVHRWSPDAVGSLYSLFYQGSGSGIHMRGTTGFSPVIDGGSFFNSVGLTLVAGNLYTFGITSDGATAKMYINGVLNNTAGSTVPSYAGTQGLVCGQGSAPPTGKHFFTGFYSRVLTGMEMLQIHQDPTQIFTLMGISGSVNTITPAVTAAWLREIKVIRPHTLDPY